MGQALYRAPKASRANAAFDGNSKRLVLIPRGRTNAVVGTLPIPNEWSELLRDAILQHLA